MFAQAQGSPRKRRGAKQPRPFSLGLKASHEEAFDPHLEKSPSSPEIGVDGNPSGVESPKKGRYD